MAPEAASFRISMMALSPPTLFWGRSNLSTVECPPRVDWLTRICDFSVSNVEKSCPIRHAFSWRVLGRTVRQSDTPKSLALLVYSGRRERESGSGSFLGPWVLRTDFSSVCECVCVCVCLFVCVCVCVCQYVCVFVWATEEEAVYTLGCVSL